MIENAGSLLLEARLITAADLEEASRRAAEVGSTITEALVLGQYVDEGRLCEFLCGTLLLPESPPSALDAPDEVVLTRVPVEVAAEIRAMPIAMEDGALRVAMSDPADAAAFAELAFFAGAPLVREVAAPTAIARALWRHYGVATPLCPQPVRRPACANADADAHADVDVDATAQAGSRAETETAMSPDRRIVPPVPQHHRPEPPAPEDGRPEPPAPVVEKPAAPVVEEPAAAGDVAVPPGIELPARPDSGGAVPPSPGAHAESDTALFVGLRALDEAETPEQVADAVVRYLGRLCRRSAFFTRRGDSLRGWLGRGPGVRYDTLLRARLRLSVPSTFAALAREIGSYVGPIHHDATACDFLIDALGSVPDDIVAVSIEAGGTVIGVGYGDSVRHPIAHEALAQVARRAGEALERARRVA